MMTVASKCHRSLQKREHQPLGSSGGFVLVPASRGQARFPRFDTPHLTVPQLMICFNSYCQKSDICVDKYMIGFHALRSVMGSAETADLTLAGLLFYPIPVISCIDISSREFRLAIPVTSRSQSSMTGMPAAFARGLSSLALGARL